ncbi:hypothetical protein EX895_001197 [Sporisorium graminicola]|uniref:DNA polymerase delta subunit 3 n=1 Tax=Sporisorium graminicola TaxID=280036 RepID=A0A4U7KZA6_9BASI|nr:hypothetical protein EX895_001197 [Sporisorium graminicola]TKY89900.1 hypothetical protein EX895_001197 [Sporisorium graminicola]
MTTATDPTSLLTAWLQRDKKLVTYRLLSRELRIHVDEAKKQLAAFYKSHKDKSDLDATYIVIGTSAAGPAQARDVTSTASDSQADQDAEEKPVASSSTPSSSFAPPPSFLDSRVTHRQTTANVSSQVIRLIPADDLDQARSSLDQISSCHIYSLSPGRLRDATQLTAVQHDLHTQQKYTDTWQQTNRGADLGVVINPNIKDNYDPTKSIPSLGAASAPALPPSNRNAMSQIKQEPDTKASSTPTAKSTTAAPPASSAGGKKAGLDWSRAKPKGPQSDSKSTAAVTKEAASSTKRSSARKALLGSDDEDDHDDSSTKPILVDDEEDEDEDDGKPEKLGYADDDDDDDDMADPVQGAARRGTGKRADAGSQSKAQQAAQRKELEAMMDSDADDDDATQVVGPSGGGAGYTESTGQGKDLDPDVEMADSTVTDTMDGSAATAAKRRVRKKRKIGSKKVRTKDERGYTVTKTVDEYESYSSDESDTPVVVGSKRSNGTTQRKETTESRSTSTSASASPAPPAPPAKPTPAAASSSNSSGLRKSSSGGAAPTSAKKGQQSLNSFFTRKPKDK